MAAAALRDWRLRPPEPLVPPPLLGPLLLPPPLPLPPPALPLGGGVSTPRCSSICMHVIHDTLLQSDCM